LRSCLANVLRLRIKGRPASISVATAG
jgi:hypothetical protein